MTEFGHVDGRPLKKERAFVSVFLFLQCLTLAHFVHDGWFRYISEMAQHPPVEGTPIYVLFGTPTQPLHAPETYRMAIPALGRALLHLFHLKHPSVVAAGLDFVFAFSALYLFYLLAVNGLSLSPAKLKGRILVIALFLAFVQFPINWIVPWQRPETLPTALFLAVAVFCLTKANENRGWSVLLLGATACQAFVRSDVPFVFGIALLLIPFSRKSLFEEFGSRSFNLLMGTCVTLIAGGVQLYLQLIRYPHLSYWPGTDLVQFKHNLHLHNLSNCMLALSPFLLLAIFMIVKRIPITAIEAILLLSSALYFPLWFTVGVVGEVRIFVPFLIALSVAAARVSASFLTDTLAET